MKILSHIYSYFLLPPIILNKKTLLDLGDDFKISSYFENEDMTVVSHGNKSSNKCAIFLPGIDMSGLSVYPHIIGLSEDISTYTFVSHDLKLPDITEMVRCIGYFIDGMNDYEEITLVGESCGAILALNSMGKCSKTITKLVLLNPATSFWEMSNKDSVFEKLVNPLEIMYNSPSFGDISDSIMGLVDAFPSNKKYHYLVYFYMLYNQFSFSKVGSIHRISNWIGESCNMTMDCIQKYLSCEIVLILGEKDSLIPQDTCRKIFKGYMDNIKECWIPKGTHLLTPNLVDIGKWIH